MDKAKIIFSLLLFGFLMIPVAQLYAQDLFTKELHWVHSDSTNKHSFDNKEMLIEWGEKQVPFPTVYSKYFLIKNDTILVVMVEGCSGIPCWGIYVAKEIGQRWEIIVSSKSRINEPIDVKVEENQHKIIFKTKSGQIGEIQFDEL